MPSKTSQSRVTQRDVGRAAGVDVSTVSLCLNGHPRIPEATRSRVLAVAAELGYRRDPALSAIAASRWSRTRDKTGLVIAFVVDDWNASEIELRLYLEGVRAQAEVLGYRIETLELTDYPRVEALHRVVRARSIRGIVTGQTRVELPQELFTGADVPVVHCGYLRDVPGDTVCPDLRAAVVQLAAALLRNDRRVACFLPAEPHLHSDQAILGAALALASPRKGKGFRTFHVAPTMPPRALEALRQWRPDEIITINEHQAARIEATGIVPR